MLDDAPSPENSKHDQQSQDRGHGIVGIERVASPQVMQLEFLGEDVGAGEKQGGDVEPEIGHSNKAGTQLMPCEMENGSTESQSDHRFRSVGQGEDDDVEDVGKILRQHPGS